MRELIFRDKENAAAKLNLSLEILERRPDNYHNLESLMVTVDLCDQLSLSLFSDTNAKWQVSGNQGDMPQDKNNITYTAALAFFKWHNINPLNYSLEIFIEKNIPSQAGLGGGSADAAATIRLLERAFFPGNDFKAMSTAFMAREIGADVPYCYNGKTQYVSSIGEVLTEFPDFPTLPLLLLIPPITISTKEAYSSLDANPRKCHAQDRDIFLEKYTDIISSKNYSDISSFMKNSFLPYLEHSNPEISDYLNALKNTESLFVSLSGSGPTLFALYDDGVDVKHKASSLSEMFPWVSVIETKIST